MPPRTPLLFVWPAMAMALAIGLAACARTEPPSPFAREALYFVDAIRGEDAALAALEAIAADEPAFSLTVVRTQSALLQALSAGPDLIVAFNQGATMRADVGAALVDWIAGGGRIVAFDWFWLPEVAASLGVDVVSTNHDLLTVTDPLLTGGSPSLTLPLANAGWTTTFATGFTQTVGTVAATFDDASAAIVFGNQGRTAAVGFTNDALELAAGAALFRRLFETLIQRLAPTDG